MGRCHNSVRSHLIIIAISSINILPIAILRFMFMPGNKFSFSRSLPPPSSSPLSPSLYLSCQATPRPPTPPSRTAANEQRTVQAHILTTEALISLKLTRNVSLFKDLLSVKKGTVASADQNLSCWCF